MQQSLVELASLLMQCFTKHSGVRLHCRVDGVGFVADGAVNRQCRTCQGFVECGQAMLEGAIEGLGTLKQLAIKRMLMALQGIIDQLAATGE